MTSATPMTHTRSHAAIFAENLRLNAIRSMRIETIGTNDKMMVISDTGMYSMALYSQK